MTQTWSRGSASRARHVHQSPPARLTPEPPRDGGQELERWIEGLGALSGSPGAFTFERRRCQLKGSFAACQSDSRLLLLAGQTQAERHGRRGSCQKAISDRRALLPDEAALLPAHREDPSPVRHTGPLLSERTSRTTFL